MLVNVTKPTNFTPPQFQCAKSHCSFLSGDIYIGTQELHQPSSRERVSLLRLHYCIQKFHLLKLSGKHERKKLESNYQQRRKSWRDRFPPTYKVGGDEYVIAPPPLFIPQCLCHIHFQRCQRSRYIK